MPNRKELRRIKKSELLKICLDNSIDCNRKSSKNELVDKIFKNKELRNSLSAHKHESTFCADKGVLNYAIYW